MKNILVLAAVALIAIPLSAQRNNGSEEARAKAEEARKEMHEWFTNEVVPTLQKWHQEYDASLTTAQRQELDQLRAEAKKVKESIHAEMKQLKQQIREAEDRKEVHKQLRELKKSHKEEMRSIIERVKPIAEASRDQLMKLRDDNEEQIKAWKEEARAKMKETREEMKELRERVERDAREAREHNRNRRRHREHHRGPHELGMLFEGGRKAALRFLLWDGTVPELPEDNAGVMDFSARNRQLGTVRVAPNPGNATASVNMDKIPGSVATIEVYDMNGSLVASESATVSNGSIDKRIDTSSLAPGTYMVSVNTSSGRKTTTLVINQ